MKRAVVFACGCILAVCSVRAALEPPVPVRIVNPVFPIEMRRQHISGLVLVNCHIDERGEVHDPRVIKASNDAFAEPALNALRKWKFKPAQKDGTNVPIDVTIPVRFTIEE